MTNSPGPKSATSTRATVSVPTDAQRRRSSTASTTWPSWNTWPAPANQCCAVSIRATASHRWSCTAPTAEVPRSMLRKQLRSNTTTLPVEQLDGPTTCATTNLLIIQATWAWMGKTEPMAEANEDETVSLSRSALDVLIADLERSRRVGWARAYAAEEQLARGRGEVAGQGPPASSAVPDSRDDASEDAARRSAIQQIDEATRTITRWFKPLWYDAAWKAGHRQLIQINDEDLAAARSLWGDRKPHQSGYIDKEGRQATSVAPRPRTWIWTVIDLMRAGVSEEVIERSVHEAMAITQSPADIWGHFMVEVESRW